MQDTLVAWFQTVIPETLTLVGMFIVMFAMDAALAAAALAIVPALVVFVVLSRPHIKAAQRQARDRSGILASRATEILRHVRAVQAFSRERLSWLTSRGRAAAEIHKWSRRYSSEVASRSVGSTTSRR